MDTNVETVEVFQSTGSKVVKGDWYWRAKGGNGEIVAASEGYTRHAGALAAAKETFPDAEIKEV